MGLALALQGDLLLRSFRGGIMGTDVTTSDQSEAAVSVTSHDPCILACLKLQGSTWLARPGRHHLIGRLVAVEWSPVGESQTPLSDEIICGGFTFGQVGKRPKCGERAVKPVCRCCHAFLEPPLSTEFSCSVDAK